MKATSQPVGGLIPSTATWAMARIIFGTQMRSTCCMTSSTMTSWTLVPVEPTPQYVYLLASVSFTCFMEAYRTIIVQTLFTAKAREIIQDHSNEDTDHPLFLYVAYQNIHGPPEVPHSHIRDNDPHGQRKIISGGDYFRSAQYPCLQNMSRSQTLKMFEQHLYQLWTKVLGR